MAIKVTVSRVICIHGSPLINILLEEYIFLSLLPKINAFSMSQTSRDITGLLMEQVCYDMAMIMMIMLMIWNNSLVEQYNNDSVTR